MNAEDSIEREHPPVMRGYVWRNYDGDAMSDPIAHQFAEPVEPDDEGIMATLCEREVMAFRVPRGAPRPPFCIHCILITGRQAAAEQDAARDRRVAAFGGCST